MTFKHPVGRLLARSPDGNVRITARGHDPAVLEERDRIHRAVVKAHDLLGDIARKRPANCRCIETARDHMRPVRRDREPSHRPAMTAQLSMNGLQAYGRSQM